MLQFVSMLRFAIQSGNEQSGSIQLFITAPLTLRKYITAISDTVKILSCYFSPRDCNG